MAGLNRLLSSRCIHSILVTLEHLHECEELTIPSIDIESIGLANNLQTGYLTYFSLGHDGSEETTSGFPYYRRVRQNVGVADAFQAATVAFIYFLAPRVWTNIYEKQEILPEEDRLTPMEFIKEAINMHGWPTEE